MPSAHSQRVSILQGNIEDAKFLKRTSLDSLEFAADGKPLLKLIVYILGPNDLYLQVLANSDWLGYNWVRTVIFRLSPPIPVHKKEKNNAST